MSENLKKTLRDLHASRLIDYGNLAYQQLSNDWQFEDVPSELNELWYRQDGLSFLTLCIAHDSNINYMSQDELIRKIDDERCLIARLEKVFSKIKNKKEGNANGKN